MTSYELGRARDLFATMLPTGDAPPTIEQIRQAYEDMCGRLEIPAAARMEHISIAGVSCISVQADAQSPPDRTIVWFHSGGYVVGSASGYRSLGAHLARAANARVLLVDYRLAPEFPYPAALEDALAVYGGVVADQPGGASAVVLAGDSAGGGLALSTLVALRDAGTELPACAICCSPWTDLAQTGETIETNAAVDPAVSGSMLELCAALYLGERDRRTPLASPFYADLEGLPPVFVLVGTAETLLDDSRRFAERAAAAGVDVTLRVADDMVHIFPIFASFLPEAREAVTEMGEFAQKHAR